MCMNCPIPLPPRESMLEVADYLDEVWPGSGSHAAVAAAVIAMTLRDRAWNAEPRRTAERTERKCDRAPTLCPGCGMAGAK